tara:strand:+ start:4938 stop:5798 length:861 start_codon:yes stop_codon:yes gene_type:complete
MKKNKKSFKLNLILGFILILCLFVFRDNLRFNVFIKGFIFPEERVTKSFIFQPSINSFDDIKPQDDQRLNKEGGALEKAPKMYKKNILNFRKEINDCEEEFNAIFESFLNGESLIEVDNSRAILVLEELEGFDFRNEFYKKEYKKGVEVSPCSNQSNIVLLNQVFSENSLDSWDNETLQKMRRVLTRILADMSMLPGSIEDFENIFIQLELIHEKNLFEGIYGEEMKQLRREFEEVKGVFELRDFALESNEYKKLKKHESSKELLIKFKQKTRHFLNSTLKDFYNP